MENKRKLQEIELESYLINLVLKDNETTEVKCFLYLFKNLAGQLITLVEAFLEFRTSTYRAEKNRLQIGNLLYIYRVLLLRLILDPLIEVGKSESFSLKS